MKKEAEQLKSKIYKTGLLITRLETRVVSLEAAAKRSKEALDKAFLNKMKGVTCSRQA